MNMISFFVVLFIAFIIAFTTGDKRRIGIGWSLFFLSFWLLPGLVIVYSSPLKSQMKEPPTVDPNKGVQQIIGIVFLLLGGMMLWNAFKTPDYLYDAEAQRLYKGFMGIYLAGSAVYLFNRSEYNKSVYKEYHSIKSINKIDIVEEKETLFVAEKPNYEIAEEESKKQK